MARGITENDVWQACDALLIDGARPTIERVRQKIGSGSPNTVSPHLDAWFKQLGGRIRNPSGFAAAADVPEPVAQAAQQVWEAALAETRRDFDERLRQGMEAAVANVEAEKARAAQAESAAFDAASRSARLQAESTQRGAQVDEQRLANATLAANLADAERRADELHQRLAAMEAAATQSLEKSRTDVAAAIERLAATERRTLLEIDRERGLRARAEKRAESLERRLDASLSETKAERIKEAGVLSTLQAEKAAWVEQHRQAQQREAGLAAQLAQLNAALAQARSDAGAARSQAELVDTLMASMKAAPAALTNARIRPRKPSGKRP